MYMLRKFISNWEDITGMLSIITLSVMLFRLVSMI